MLSLVRSVSTPTFTLKHSTLILALGYPFENSNVPRVIFTVSKPNIFNLYHALPSIATASTEDYDYLTFCWTRVLSGRGFVNNRSRLQSLRWILLLLLALCQQRGLDQRASDWVDVRHPGRRRLRARAVRSAQDPEVELRRSVVARDVLALAQGVLPN